MHVRSVCKGLLFAFILLFAISAQTQEKPRQLLSGHVRSIVSSDQAVQTGAVPADQKMGLSIVPPLRNAAGLTALLGRLYDPKSPDFRHFLSVAQFTAQFGPTLADYQKVVAFAQANGFTVTDVPANRQVVSMSGSSAQIEKAFHLAMKLYRHPTEDREFFSADREPSLDLGVLIAHNSGVNNFSIPHAMLEKSATSSAEATITAICATGRPIATR
jgi:subtilase family serine protease